MHTARSSTLHTVCRQRCLLDLLSCTESAIPLISIHTIVPGGLQGIFRSIMIKLPSLVIVMSTVWFKRKAGRVNANMMAMH